MWLFGFVPCSFGFFESIDVGWRGYRSSHQTTGIVGSCYLYDFGGLVGWAILYAQVKLASSSRSRIHHIDLGKTHRCIIYFSRAIQLVLGVYAWCTLLKCPRLPKTWSLNESYPAFHSLWVSGIYSNDQQRAIKIFRYLNLEVLSRVITWGVYQRFYWFSYSHVDFEVWCEHLWGLSFAC